MQSSQAMASNQAVERMTGEPVTSSLQSGIVGGSPVIAHLIDMLLAECVQRPPPVLEGVSQHECFPLQRFIYALASGEVREFGFDSGESFPQHIKPME